MPEKNRSAAVTVIAILQLIGSALVLAMSGLLAVAMIAAPPTPNDAQLPPMFFKMIRIIAPLIYALPAVWGIITAVGLLQVKNWARISTIVFSALLLFFGAFGILTSMVFFLKPPPGKGLDPAMFAWVGVFMAVCALAQIGIGIWWMVFFNRARVKAQFQPQPLPLPHPGQGFAPYADMPSSATPPPPGFPSATDLAPSPASPLAQNRPARPLSISIIAWFLLVCCIFFPVSLFLHPPVALFLTVLIGWPAAVFILISAAISVYLGIGLLQMKPAARLVAMGYFIFGGLNAAVFYFAPGGSARLARFLDLQQSMFPWMRYAQANSQFSDPTPFLIIGAIGGIVFSVVLLYCLAAAKPAFDRAAREPGG